MILQRLAALFLVLIVLIQVLDAYPADSHKSKNLAKRHKRVKNELKALKNTGHLLNSQTGSDAITDQPAAKKPKSRKRSKKNQKKGPGSTIRAARSDGASNLLGLGVFGDMRKFFDDLRTNIASGEKTEPFYYEDMPEEALDKLLEQRIGDDGTSYQAHQSNGDGVRDRHRSRLRGFVSQVEPLRRKSQYDPALLWTGLGR